MLLSQAKVAMAATQFSLVSPQRAAAVEVLTILTTATLLVAALAVALLGTLALVTAVQALRIRVTRVATVTRMSQRIVRSVVVVVRLPLAVTVQRTANQQATVETA